MHRRLAQVLVKDPEPMLFHAEVVLRDGKPVGYVRAGSYGHTLGGAVGLAMLEAGEPLTPAWLREGRWEIDIAGKRYPAEASSSRSTILRCDASRRELLSRVLPARERGRSYLRNAFWRRQNALRPDRAAAVQRTMSLCQDPTSNALIGIAYLKRAAQEQSPDRICVASCAALSGVKLSEIWNCPPRSGSLMVVAITTRPSTTMANR